MTQKHAYNWKRFWSLRTAEVSYSDDGYLYDPDSEFGDIYNPELRSFDAIRHILCLTLLGEPGLGKSWALRNECDYIRSSVDQPEDQVCRFDLKSYENEDRLIKDLFRNEAVRRCISSGHKFYLFLDSFDECPIRRDTLASILTDELNKLPIESLHFRIACRTFDWPAWFEDGFADLWGSDNIGVYELAALRRKDVAEAVTTHNLDPDLFFDQVEEKGAVSLAVKPITLEFLLNIFVQEKAVPPNQLA